MGFILFGLTGGIASGKSTVARHGASRGLPVVDADQIAREVVAPGSEGLAAVVGAFGDGVLAPDGSLDRAKVAALVFADADARRALETLLHPRIGVATVRTAHALAEAGHPLACYEAALLVESGQADLFRPLVVVVAPESSQVERSMARDAAAEDEVRRRIASQLPMRDKIAAADWVIDNGGDPDALAHRADQVLRAIAKHEGVDPARYGV